MTCGRKLVGDHPGVVTGGGGLDLEPAVALEHIDKQFHDLGVVIDHEDFALAAVEVFGGDAVLPHEGHQGIARNPAETAPGHAETLEPARIKAPDDRLLRNLANLGGFAGGEDGLHEKSLPLTVRTTVARQLVS